MANGLGFIDPSAGGGKETILLEPRPTDLSGKVVGLLDNTKEQADIILQTVGEALCERYGVETLIIRRKEHYSKPAAAEIIEEMAGQVDVAIAGLGG
ncbi:MAG: hypothetical protein BZY85_02865 [SAR202 cluster bacterium MP-SAtl-SRR3965592-G1]|nr:MAG: hypothetical protein BZY85_02865 [SAR202 cluster bacterium MP-SAtl-SRR3965592-G1]